MISELASSNSKYVDCKCLNDVAKVSGLRINTLRSRLYKNKMPLDKAVSLPFRKNKRPMIGDSVGIDSICADYDINKSAFTYAKYKLGLSDHDSVDYAQLRKASKIVNPVDLDSNWKSALGITA